MPPKTGSMYSDVMICIRTLCHASQQVKKAEPKKKGVDCGPGSGAGGYRDGRTGGYGDQLMMMMQSIDDDDDH